MHRRVLAATVTALALASAAACGSDASPASPTTASGAASSSSGKVLNVVAAENFWGSIAEQVGGPHVKVTNIIDSPDADPHDYEATAADGRAIATADLVLVNGVGYDTWATKLAAANPAPARTTLTVGELVGVAEGGNPHRWYNPDDVTKVADQLTSDFKRLDPADATDLDQRRKAFDTTALADYKGVIADIRKTYSGTPVGASESIFSLIAPALGLDLVTPEGFLTAISEGTEPSAADKAAIDAQIKGKKIKVYVYNSQNATPDVQRQVDAARAAGIPVTTITETQTPATATWQEWQTAQLERLRDALAAAR